ncbi:bifunctional chorismate-binding protein/class IV aminotransferase [Macrococcus equi]|uniref:bifunctional chorismate-binding protein/class IV aminotransferase n=1 Tax=Macrococcus equi TaxID=3395462 RepID=UPI0039BE6137
MRAELNFKFIGQVYKHYHYQLACPKRIVSIDDGALIKDALMEAENSNDIVVVVIPYEASPLFDPLLKVKQAKQPYCIKLYYFDSCDKSTFKPKTTSNIAFDFKFKHDKSTIMQQIVTIQEEIRRGNTYQVNYTTRLTAQNMQHDLYEIYQKLSQQNGDYTAYIEDDNQTIVSISPELFFQYDLKTKEVLTKPMKGTMPASEDSTIDQQNYRFLNTSLKDKAENVMIVDLLRNDLSKIATKGSVSVPHLFTIERFKSVYQMTSTITANVGDHGLYDILKALFPCGSITGAPKQSTMEIIERLEDTPRSIYCGTIGLIVPNEVAIFNVPIRTLEYQHDTQEIVYGVGGGITIDSVPELEYEEMVAKVNVLNFIEGSRVIEKINDLPDDFHLIETMRVEDGLIKRKEYHTNRLKAGLDYFKIHYDPSNLNTIFSRQFDEGVWMYRVTVSREGDVEAAVSPLREAVQQAKLRQIKLTNLHFHQYKTSIRSQYESVGLTLFHDGKHLLEFNIGNVVIERNGVYYTPLNEYILDGCMRRSLIDAGMIEEKEILLDTFIEDYKAETINVYMVNSLREWVPVQIELD